MTGTYAAGTTVQPETSQQEIARSLRRYGADQFMYGEQEGQAVVAFRSHGRNVRFLLPIPTSLQPYRLNARGQLRTQLQQENARDAETRRRWRALALAIKAKLEVVESGIATFEEEFAVHTVMPDGRTLGEHVLPMLDNAIASGQMPTAILALPPGRDGHADA